jgi:hypothetical protein
LGFLERGGVIENLSFRAERSGVEESLINAGSGGAELFVRSSSAPPLPAKA